MAKSSKAKLDQAGLTGLGIDKLVEILLDEAAFNKALKTRLLAALAGSSGADEVARLIDKRLDTLQKGRSELSASKANDLAIELRGLLKNITSELAAFDRYAAFERIVRFAVIGSRIEERVYEGGARLAKVLSELNDSLVDVALKLDENEQTRSVALLETMRSRDEYGQFAGALKDILCGMRKPAADAWESVLRQKLLASSKGAPAWRSNEPVAFLQALASSQGDIDSYVELELSKPEERRDSLSIARMLHDAKRHAEALEWVRKPSGTMRVIHFGNGGYGVALGAQPVQMQRRLEADILDAMKERGAAQAIRWEEFERTLRPDILRSYIAKLDDFAEFEETDKALAVVARNPDIYNALAFFVQWPRLDLAAEHVVRHLGKWDGRQYEILLAAAEALEGGHPEAATLLYRVLLDDILRRGLSAAYPYGASYLAALHQLQPKLAAGFGHQSHQEYVVALQKKHGRKYGFWELVPRELL